jgi:hypothetical protein
MTAFEWRGRFGPHDPLCAFPWQIFVGDQPCRCARLFQERLEWGLVGQRMTIPRPGVVAHECTDDAGLVFFDDGRVVAWHRTADRLSGPSWTYRRPREP